MFNNILGASQADQIDKQDGLPKNYLLSTCIEISLKTSLDL